MNEKELYTLEEIGYQELSAIVSRGLMAYLMRINAVNFIGSPVPVFTSRTEGYTIFDSPVDFKYYVINFSYSVHRKSVPPTVPIKIINCEQYDLDKHGKLWHVVGRKKMEKDLTKQEWDTIKHFDDKPLIG